MNVKELDSTKIYWLDKEETVKVKLVGLDMTHGFGSAKYTFRVLFGGAGDIVYMDSNFPKTIHEIVERKNWSFTTPIAMKCTEDQFNGIKGKLVEMGYKEVCMSNWDEGDYIVNNLMKHIGSLSNIFDVDANEFGRIMVDTFNPDLFLALAAMTDKEDGIKGEWWKSGLTGNLITQSESSFSHPILRKATAQEIIEHFEKKEFVLPKFWNVVVTEENVDVLSKWRFGEEYPKHKLNIGYIVGFSLWQNSKQHNPSDSRGSFGSEITFDKFKKCMSKETEQSCQIIPIPPTKQATLFDDRVEIADWEPKEGEIVWVVTNEIGSLIYKDVEYNGSLLHAFLFRNGFIKRTECEAKRLVEKLKQAML